MACSTIACLIKSSLSKCYMTNETLNCFQTLMYTFNMITYKFWTFMDVQIHVVLKLIGAQNPYCNNDTWIISTFMNCLIVIFEPQWLSHKCLLTNVTHMIFLAFMHKFKCLFIFQRSMNHLEPSWYFQWIEVLQFQIHTGILLVDMLQVAAHLL